MLPSIGDAINFLPIGIFFAIGIPSLVSGIVETEWLDWPLLVREGSRLRRIGIGVVFLTLAFAMLYFRRSALAANLLPNSISILAGFAFVLGAAYLNQRRA